MKIAVIGGGIGGLTSAYYLGQEHDVTLFEKTHRVGGNAYNLDTKTGENVDIAVAAYGTAGYTNFHAMLQELDVKTVGSSAYMSFHDLESKKGLYLTPSLKGSYSQMFDILKPGNLKSLVNLYMGLRAARKKLKTGYWDEMTLDQCLEEIPQIDDKARMIFLCILCLISSMAADEVLQTPAAFFLKKIDVHNDLLTPRAVHSIRCIKDGTKTYVNALVDRIGSENINLNTEVIRVKRADSKVTVVTDEGSFEFDKVIFACPADLPLKLLEAPTANEKKILGVWSYKKGRVVVHRDHSDFPARNLIQAYTFLYTENGDKFDTSVNGALWYEPHASDNSDYISSQHPNFPIREDLIDLDTHLYTPIFDFDSFATVDKLDSLNGKENTYYCGSYFGFGLHEDAVRSAMNIAESLGVSINREPASEESFIAASLKKQLRKRLPFGRSKD